MPIDSADMAGAAHAIDCAREFAAAKHLFR
jgi:hypothetical protein